MNSIKNTFIKEIIKGLILEDVYCGSALDFDKFSRRFIGSGEGNLARGYGFYFALDPDIALNRYQKRLTAWKTLKINGNPVKRISKWCFLFNNKEIEANYLSTQESSIIAGIVYYIMNNCPHRYELDVGSIDHNPSTLLEKWKQLLNSKRVELEKETSDSWNAKRCFETIEFLEKACEFLENNKFEMENGVTKQVEIPDMEFLLKEDHYYKDQSDFIKSALDKMYERFYQKGISLNFFIPKVEHLLDINLKCLIVLSEYPDCDIFMRGGYDEYDNWDDNLFQGLNEYEIERIFSEEIEDKLLLKYFNMNNKNTKITREILEKEVSNIKVKIFPSNYKKYRGRKILQKMTDRINLYLYIFQKKDYDYNYAKKMVSQFMKSVGIKGYFYTGTVDGECVVIFDSSDIKIVKSFYDRNQITLKPLDN